MRLTRALVTVTMLAAELLAQKAGLQAGPFQVCGGDSQSSASYPTYPLRRGRLRSSGRVSFNASSSRSLLFGVLSSFFAELGTLSPDCDAERSASNPSQDLTLPE